MEKEEIEKDIKKAKETLEDLENYEYKQKEAQKEANTIKPYQNLSVRFLVSMLFLFLVTTALLIPKVYIRDQIYYISRDLSKLDKALRNIEQENLEIKLKLTKALKDYKQEK